jgi:hypothetical protein
MPVFCFFGLLFVLLRLQETGHVLNSEVSAQVRAVITLQHPWASSAWRQAAK